MSEAPHRIGKYEIRREVGRGAMGVVYEAFDPAIERTVALKTLIGAQAADGEAQEMSARFQREAKAAGRLNHPNIVAIYDFGEDNGTAFIAMEFVRGRELKDYFEKGERFALPDIVRVMGQLLDALDYSHQNGVVHRDIKPANIILLPDGRVKVTDFGIARIESSQFTQAGTVLGTPAYMSPEQFMGQTVDRRSDIFSAGVVLYQFLTGERPFSGSATTIMHKVLQEDPLPPSMLNVQAPQPFDAVIGKAIAKRPDQRYQTAREFADAIRVAAEGKSTADGTVINLADATVVESGAGAGTMVQSAATPAPAVPSRRRLPLPVAVAAIAVLGAGIAGYFALRGPPGASPAIGIAATAPATAATPGTLVISAIGLADPGDQKYQADKTLLTDDLRADSRSQLVEKAAALYVTPDSLARNYELLRDKLLSRSGDYIENVAEESAPQLGKDGLMYVTTRATVKVREVQKSLNQMSQDERIAFIRNNGDPKISVAISVGDDSGAPAQNSPVAENLLKERIKSFGFRIWSDQPSYAPGKGADFAAVGEARLKKLSVRLPASGLTIDKYLLTSWTVKCIDQSSGEEIYYNNTLPAAAGSWATQEQALAAIGGKIADQFSRDFFLEHFNATGQGVTLKIGGLPDAATENAVERELLGLRQVIDVSRRGISSSAYDLQLAGGGPPADLVAGAILKPLNAKLGRACFSLGAVSGAQIDVVFDPACDGKDVLTRFDTNPPAALYAAPPARQKSVLRNPDALRRLTI
ncbi:MAG TPA: serine/threonine-protein kinase [Burkholderiales bacterium]|nr:serine/threonine-protein kinase [Burkholderiales bacterium]